MAESIKTLATEKHAESRELSIFRLGFLFCNYISPLSLLHVYSFCDYKLILTVHFANFQPNAASVKIGFGFALRLYMQQNN